MLDVAPVHKFHVAPLHVVVEQLLDGGRLLTPPSHQEGLPVQQLNHRGQSACRCSMDQAATSELGPTFRS